MSDNLEIGVLFSLMILILYILGAHIIEINKIDFIHESGMAILMGAISSLIIHAINSEPMKFEESTFFVFILPPIIFAAGYNLKKKNFVENFGFITLFGILGTIISFIVLSVLIIFCNSMLHNEDSKLYLHTKECLLLAAVLCATDTVAALTIVKEKTFPTLNSILFGEGVVNDAISILLFRAVEKMMKADVAAGKIGGMDDSKGLQITFTDVMSIGVSFCYLSFCSIFIGICFGLLCAYVFKVLRLENHPVREIFLLLLFGYASYITSELLGYSGIMTLFCCGLSMAHYAYKNLSAKSKIGSVLAIETIGHGAEAFVFTYLGMSIYSMEQQQVSYSFVFFLLISCVVARACGVFIPALIVSVCKRFQISLDLKQLTLIWFSGIIRGAIAFALSLQISEKLSPHTSLMISSTLVVVLTTTLLFGGLMSIFTKFIGMSKERRSLTYTKLGESSGMVASNRPVKYDFEEEHKPGFFGRMWEQLDEKYMGPIFLKKDPENPTQYEEYGSESIYEEQKENSLERQREEDLMDRSISRNSREFQSISPPSFKKSAKRDKNPQGTKEIEMKSIIFN